MIKLGDCRNEQLIEELFGSVTEFAQQIEERGNTFTYGKLKVEYNQRRDIHTFWQISQAQNTETFSNKVIA